MRKQSFFNPFIAEKKSIYDGFLDGMPARTKSRFGIDLELELYSTELEMGTAFPERHKGEKRAWKEIP